MANLSSPGRSASADNRLTRALRWRLRRAAKRFRQVTGRFHVLPEALVIGVQKGGTTSLYRYLEQHPQVLPSRKKEPNYFSGQYRRGLGWYRSFYPLSLEARLNPSAFAIDASVSTIYHPYAPERVQAIIPDARLIALLRDPVERAWSHYHHILRLDDEPREHLPFEQAIWQEEARLHEYRQRLERDPLHHDLSVNRFTYLSRGLYAEQLRRWLHRFERDQLLVIASEELFATPEVTLARVLDFLGLPPREGLVYRRTNRGQNKPATLPRAVREELRAYFVPHNQELYELIGRDLGWPGPGGAGSS